MTARAGFPDWDERLRAAGLRSTAPRRAVLTAMAQLRHATVDELAAALQRDAPDLSLSTVYRTVETLSDVGLIRHAHLHHGSPTYHEVDEQPHIHLVCRRCGSVGELPTDVAHGLAEQADARLGFTADLTHLVLHGLCRDCQSDDDVPHVPQAVERRSLATEGAGSGSAGPDQVLPST